jgi:peptidyl-tRNA hydrolase
LTEPAADIGAALRPLRERYQHWLNLDAAQVLDDREEAANDIRAMQLVLRMERADPPSWHRALAAAATGAAALCLDPRSQPGGPWYDAIGDYCKGHIRKVTRRARGAHWVAAQDLPGITIDLDGTQVRALLPGLVNELDPRISRLQVGGTDVAPGDPPAGEPTPSYLQMWLAPDSAMTLGKAMAQTGHAGMIAVALLTGVDQQALEAWMAVGYPAAVRRAGAEEWSRLSAQVTGSAADFGASRLLGVRDAGFTEVDPGTITVIAKAPDPLRGR